MNYLQIYVLLEKANDGYAGRYLESSYRYVEKHLKRELTDNERRHVSDALTQLSAGRSLLGSVRLEG